MPEIKEKENSPKVVPLTFNDMIWLQLQEMGKRFDQIDKDRKSTRLNSSH